MDEARRQQLKQERIANLKRGREAKAAKRLNQIPTDTLPVAPPSLTFDFPSAIDAFDFSQLDRAEVQRHMDSIRKAYDRCGQALKQANAVYEAEVGIVQCKTCKRPIDIRKPGSYQIRSDYNELHQLVNNYWCSQECLLGFSQFKGQREAEERAMVKRTEVR